MSQNLAAMMGSPSDGARGVEDPLCGRPERYHSPRDDSPAGHGTTKRDRNREGIPSPQQAAQGEDHDIASMSLGVPLVSLDSHGQAPPPLRPPRPSPAWNSGSFKPISQCKVTLTVLCMSLSLGGTPISLDSHCNFTKEDGGLHTHGQSPDA